MHDDPDGTVKIARPAPPAVPRNVAARLMLLGAAGAVGLAILGGGGWMLLRPGTPRDVPQREIAGPGPQPNPQALAPQALAPQAPAPQGQAPQALTPQAPAPQAPATQALAPQALAPQPSAPPPAAPMPQAPQLAAPQQAAPRMLPPPQPPPAATSPPTVTAAFAPPSPPILQPPAPSPLQPAPLQPALVQPPIVLTEAEVLARAPAGVEAYRFAPAPEIFVLQFGSLAEQARALNRAAALIEKAGYPRDRVLDLAELDRRIRAEGAEPDSFYYGHDYRAADLVRFFEMLRAAGLPPSEGEAALARMIESWGWTRNTNAALISLVREDRAAGLGPAVRATILRHELSHGLYFTSPAYARYAHEFWSGMLTQPERGKFRAFLASEGYDTGIEDLVINETQAYLMHTANDRFFNAQAIGISDRRLEALRVLFLTGMPPGWLRDCTTVPVRSPRRRPYRLSAVRRTRTVAERRAPPRIAFSTAVRSSFT